VAWYLVKHNLQARFKKMRTKDAVRYFVTVRRLADALGLSTQAVYQWGSVVPELQAYRLERISKGVLRADDADDAEPRA